MTDVEIFENEIKCITRRNECICNGGTDCVKCDLLMDSEEILKCYNRAIKNTALVSHQKAEIERYLHSIKLLEKDVEVIENKIIQIEAQRDALLEELQRLADCSSCKFNAPNAVDGCSALMPCKDGHLWEWKGDKQ